MKSKDTLSAISLNLVIDDMPFDIWIKDINGIYIDVNRHFIESCGKSKEDIIGKKDYDIYPKTEADIYVASDKHIIMKQKPEHFEAEIQKGRFREEFKEPIFDKSGKLIGTAGFSRDITKKKKMVNALAESERSKSMLLSNLPGVAYRCNTDPEWTMTFISEGCFNLTGYTSDELLNKKPSYYELIPSGYRSILLAQRKTDCSSNRISTNEYPIITSAGVIKWVWGKSQGVYDTDHNLIAVEGFIIDITEKKLAENALSQSEERFRTLFEEAPLGIGILDSVDGKVYQVNKKLAEIIGRSKEELQSSNWKDCVYPDEIEEILQNLEFVNKGKTPNYSMQKKFIKPDGTLVWTSMSVAPFKQLGRSNSIHLCMIKDVTEQKQAEDKIFYLSYHDKLTGLHNRLFYEEEIKKINTESNLPITLVVADVNGLKLTNESFGHMAGDQLLKKIAEIMKRECRDNDVVARTGGDEFTIILLKTSYSQTEKLIQRIKSAISFESRDGICSVSFGWATKRKPLEEIKKVYMFAEDHMYRSKLSENANLRDETIKIIVETLYQKNKREQQHCERVSGLCEEIGIALGMDSIDIEKLKTAGLLHDIGKIGIDEKLLNKESALTEFEWMDIKRHTEIGYHILRAASEFIPIAEYVLYHHERVDGQGYPRGLMGEEIPLQSKIICIADSYDAMTGVRTYKKVLSKFEAIQEIKTYAGIQFDSNIAKIFIEKVLGVKWDLI